MVNENLNVDTRSNKKINRGLIANNDTQKFNMHIVCISFVIFSILNPYHSSYCPYTTMNQNKIRCLKNGSNRKHVFFKQ